MKESVYLTESTLLRKKTRKKLVRIPLVITYNRFLPKITKTVKKNWNILRTNEKLKEIFKNEAITASKRNKDKQRLGHIG